MVNEIFGSKATIFAFEPSKITFSKMAENTKDLKNISRYNFGFGNNTAKTTLYTNSDASGLASIYKRNLQHFNINMDQEEIVEMRTIDDFCLDTYTHGGVSHIHFLKIDVEGHELNVLEGARGKIGANGIDYIQFEFGGCNIDSRTYFQDFWYLLKDKYRFYRILKDGLFEIIGYKEIYECFITTNFLLEKK